MNTITITGNPNEDFGSAFAACLGDILKLPAEAFPNSGPGVFASSTEEEIMAAWDSYFIELDRKLQRMWKLQLLSLDVENAERAEFRPQGWHIIVGQDADDTDYALVGYRGEIVGSPYPESFRDDITPRVWFLLVPVEPSIAVQVAE